jgi:transposase-like protein
MPWRCPACQIPIRHSDVESKPREGARYRCHVCRLELTLNSETNRLTVTPIEERRPVNDRSRKKTS